MLHGAARPGDVVDVDARHRDPRQGSLEHDRELVAEQLHERRVVDARTRDDEPVGVLGTKQRRVHRFLPVRFQRFDQDPEATAAGGRCQAAQGLGEDRVAGDLLGRLAEDEGQDVAAPTCQLAGRRVRVVAQPLSREEDPLARLLGDLHVGAVVQHEGHGRPRDPCRGRDVGAGRSSGHARLPLLLLDAASPTWSTNACQ